MFSFSKIYVISVLFQCFEEVQSNTLDCDAAKIDEFPTTSQASDLSKCLSAVLTKLNADPIMMLSQDVSTKMASFKGKQTITGPHCCM